MSVRVFFVCLLQKMYRELLYSLLDTHLQRTSKWTRSDKHYKF